MARLGLFVVLLALTTGCSHLTVLRVQELRDVSAHVDSLGARLDSTQQQLLALQKEQQEIVRLIRADQQVRFAELGRQIDMLEGGINESQQRLTQIDRKTQEIKQSWEEKARADSLVETQRTNEMNKLLQLAQDDFQARRYDLALKGFEDIRNRFPATPQCEEAAYRIAECWYAQQKLEEADNAYKAYLKEYKDGKSACLAMYKLGMIYEKQNKDKARELMWKKVVEVCPQSEEAAAIKQKLKLQ